MLNDHHGGYKSFNIVNGCRLFKDTGHCWIRRLIPWLTTLPFDRLKESTFFTADICTTAQPVFNIEIVSYLLNHLMEQSEFDHEFWKKIPVFTAKVHDTFFCTYSFTGNSHSSVNLI